MVSLVPLGHRWRVVTAGANKVTRVVATGITDGTSSVISHVIRLQSPELQYHNSSETTHAVQVNYVTASGIIVEDNRIHGWRTFRENAVRWSSTVEQVNGSNSHTSPRHRTV